MTTAVLHRQLTGSATYNDYRSMLVMKFSKLSFCVLPFWTFFQPRCILIHRPGYHTSASFTAFCSAVALRRQSVSVHSLWGRRHTPSDRREEMSTLYPSFIRYTRGSATSRLEMCRLSIPSTWLIWWKHLSVVFLFHIGRSVLQSFAIHAGRLH